MTNSDDRPLENQLKDAERALQNAREMAKHSNRQRSRFELQCAEWRTRADELEERIGILKVRIGNRELGVQVYEAQVS